MFAKKSAPVPAAQAVKFSLPSFGSGKQSTKSIKKVKTPSKSGNGVSGRSPQFTLGLSEKKGGIPITLGFTKSNELFVSRMAMVGFAAALTGEVLTGQGALAQLGFETGITNIQELDFIVAAVALFNLTAALIPTKGKFVGEEDFSDRAPGVFQDPKISLATPKRFFGFSKFGSFSKENELFVGRLAQLGFAASLIGESFTGKGPLGQFGLETGIPLNQTEPLLLAFILLTFLGAINEGTGKFVDED